MTIHLSINIGAIQITELVSTGVPPHVSITIRLSESETTVQTGFQTCQENFARQAEELPGKVYDQILTHC